MTKCQNSLTNQRSLKIINEELSIYNLNSDRLFKDYSKDELTALAVVLKKKVEDRTGKQQSNSFMAEIVGIITEDGWTLNRFNDAFKYYIKHGKNYNGQFDCETFLGFDRKAITQNKLLDLIKKEGRSRSEFVKFDTGKWVMFWDLNNGECPFPESRK